MADSAPIPSATTTFRIPEPLSLRGNLAENFKKFKSRFNVYMKATGNILREDDVKVAILLNIIGDEAHDVYDTFELTAAEADNYDTVINAFEMHCIPKKNVVCERYQFYKRNKEPNETFDQFLTDIRRLSKTCDFGELNDSMLKDRIVLGASDQALHERLLRIPDLDLKKAIEYCQAAEISQGQAKIIQGEKKINAIRKSYHNNSENKMVDASVGRREYNVVKLESYMCKKCGRRHEPRKCPAFGKKCNLCNKMNHYAVGCFKKKTNDVNKYKKKFIKKMAGLSISRNEDSDSESEESILKLDALKHNKIKNEKSWMELLKVNKMEILFKLDTGSELNILPWEIYKKLKNKGEERRSTEKILTYGGTLLIPEVVTTLTCQKGEKQVKLKFTIIKTNDVPILGIDACETLQLIKRIKNISTLKSKYMTKEDFIKLNIKVFTGIGCYPIEQRIWLKDNAIPKIRPAYRIAESLKVRLKQTLDKYESNKIITKISHPTEWVHNLVIREKADKTLRLCLDPKEINKVIKREHFPIPTLEEITPKLSNKKLYTVLDMSNGFFQLKLNNKSSELCTFHTPYGRYKFNRMPFGLSSAPEVFQRITSQIFGEIKNVVVYFDDLIIATDSETEHDETLEEVIKKAKQYNLTFNTEKVQFKVSKVKYMGQLFTELGSKPDPDQVKAIRELKAPNNKKELQQLLGMINYVGKYIPQLAQVSSPLRSLLRKGIQWTWQHEHEVALKEIKERITNSPTLKCYNPKETLTIQTDSSSEGLGSCLLMNGQPISFASRSLTETEKNYAQIEKELLAVCYACKKFHTYIYGRRIVVNSDHKPLETVLKMDMGKVTARLQRMCLFLLKYDIEVKYLPGKLMYIADLLSRNYQKLEKEDLIQFDKVHTVKTIMPVSETKMIKLQEETTTDSELAKIKNYWIKGWPNNKNKISNEVKWAWKLKTRLHVKENLVMLGDKIVIPKTLRKEMLVLLHESHFGVIKTKKRAQQLLYWPGMSKQIEELIGKCKICEKYRSANTKEPLIQRPLPNYPYEVIGTDICAYGKKEYLIVACYLTKWLDIIELENKTTENIIEKLKVLFGTHGIPREIVSDNSPFNSMAFKKFADEWSINQSFSSPYYPKSNGLAEKMVGISKTILRKMDKTTDLQIALLNYRTSPIDGISESPAQMLMGRQLRTKLPITTDMLRPKDRVDVKPQMERKRARQKKYYNQHAHERSMLRPGDNIMVKQPQGWEPGIIKSLHDKPRSYIVTTENNKDYRRNSRDIKNSKNKPVIKMEDQYDQDFQEIIIRERKENPRAENDRVGMQEIGAYRTRSGRVIRKPNWAKDYV